MCSRNSPHGGAVLHDRLSWCEAVEKLADSVVQAVSGGLLCVSAEPAFPPANDLAEFPNVTVLGRRS